MHEKKPCIWFGIRYSSVASSRGATGYVLCATHAGVPPPLHRKDCNYKENARNLLRRETRGEEAVLVGLSVYTPDYLASYNYARPP